MKQKPFRVTLIIPAKNEEHNLIHVLPKIPSIVDEVLLIDGNSIDKTEELARELCPEINIIAQKGHGKGDAIREGIRRATGDIIVMLDADGSMDPEEIPDFIEPLLNGYDLVRGSRFLPGGGTSDMEMRRKLGNRFLVSLANILFGCRHSDLCYGYMAFKRDIIQKFQFESDGFEIETELTIKALKYGLRMIEVPSYEKHRVNGNSKLRCVQDGLRIFMTILGLRLKRASESEKLFKISVPY